MSSLPREYYSVSATEVLLQEDISRSTRKESLCEAEWSTFSILDSERGTNCSEEGSKKDGGEPVKSVGWSREACIFSEERMVVSSWCSASTKITRNREKTTKNISSDSST